MAGWLAGWLPCSGDDTAVDRCVRSQLCWIAPGSSVRTAKWLPGALTAP